MCRQLGFSSSGYHAWNDRPPSEPAMADGNAPYSGPDYSHPVEYENTMQPTNKISSLQPSTKAGQFHKVHMVLDRSRRTLGPVRL